MSTLLRGGALQVTVALAVTLGASSARAVPAFARKYGTSCQTCHVAFPKNTPFGEAFRRNGYRFPSGGDEDARKEEPVKLGADGYKDVFPDAVWPGELPRSVPLSVIAASMATASPSTEAKVDLSGVGGSVSLNAATSLGDRISLWAGVMVMGSTADSAMVSIERVFAVISAFDRPYLNFRIGRIEPGVFSFSMHRTLGLTPWISSSMVGDNPWALEPTQTGVEATGVVLGGRGTYSLGLVEGAGRLNLPKDYYGRVGYKLGGLRLDGEAQDGALNLADPAPWREWSVQVGGFGYSGLSSLGSPDTASQDDRFWTAGGDLNAQLRDASVILAYTYSHHGRPILASPGQAVDSTQLMAQVDYVVFPWLIPTARYERQVLTAAPEERVSAGVYLLARANVRVLLLGALHRPDGGGFDFDSAILGLSIGI